MCFCVVFVLFCFVLDECSFGGSKSTKYERNRKISLFGLGGLLLFLVLFW